MEPALQEWHLKTRRLGRRVLVYDSVDSTNTLAMSLSSDPGNDGTVILAQEQTAGRGRQGRTWLCPSGAGVLASILIFPPLAMRKPAILTAFAAVAVCETIRSLTPLQARIKWPNDILIHGKKVGGILIDQGVGTVIGIGLNVNQPPAFFKQAGLDQAASLACFYEKTLEAPLVAQALIHQLDEEYDCLCQGDWAALEACWKRRVGLLGKQVVAECVQGHYAGRLRDMTFAALELETKDQGIIALLPESVQRLSLASDSGK